MVIKLDYQPGKEGDWPGPSEWVFGHLINCTFVNKCVSNSIMLTKAVLCSAGCRISIKTLSIKHLSEQWTAPRYNEIQQITERSRFLKIQ